jgi:hypothetical protein
LIISAYLPVKRRKPPMSNDQERRKYKRIEEPYVVRFRIRSGKAQEMESDDWDSVTLMDISAGGTFFYYKKDLGIGTILDLKIDVSKSTPTINCVGKVTRSDKLRPACVCIAIKFIDIGEQEKEMINTTVDKFSKYKISHF